MDKSERVCSVHGMKHILCYGDSNTWGYTPGSGERFSRQQRWPGVLARILGKSFHVIEDGLNGRTTAFDDPDEPGRSGLAGLEAVLADCPALDMVILMLGTNDLKQHLNAGAGDIARGAERLIERIAAYAHKAGWRPPQILLVSPPAIEAVSPYIAEVFEGGFAASRELPRLFAEMAGRHGCHFLDAQEYVRVSGVDGVHLDRAGHTSLARAIARPVRLALS